MTGGIYGNNMGRRGRPRKEVEEEVPVTPPKPPSKRKGGFLDKVKPSDQARVLARSHVELAINALVESAKQTSNLNARVRAAVELLDRGYGKPHLMLEQKELPPTTQVKISFGETTVTSDQKPVLLPQIDGEVEDYEDSN